MSAKKSLFILSILSSIFISSSICGTAEATDNRPRADRRYRGQLIGAYAGAPSTQTLTLSNPYWYIILDAAGYSDQFFYGPSPRHPYGYHELLSGEWGAAIYYDGISTEPYAMWLTNYFIFPDWSTNSDFEIFQDPNVWDDPCNPVVGNDTGYSVIRNGQVEVRIDYEMVDLGEQDANTGEGGSPLAFRDANDMPVFVYSERYVLLQTYTIKNIDQNDINNLEFYQMLVGLIAEHSVYETRFLNDPLEDYTPYNPVHKLGNFHYDITQWKDPSEADPNHGDWIGFSSTVKPDIEPNSFDNGSYGAHSGSGTDWRIEQRTLNGEPNNEGESPLVYVAGATGWYLGMLEPNESVSLTLALMPGAGPIVTSLVELTKVDDVDDGDCVGPGDLITYTIDYNYPTGPNCPDINDVNIIDYLPAEVDFNSASDGGTYDSNSHTVTWEIGTLSPGTAGSVTLTVKVKPCVQPCITITNECEIKSGEQVLVIAYEYTPVCSPTLTKVDNVSGCVAPDVNITYSICYDANGYGDTNVAITDTLPNEVNYVSSDPCGFYDTGPPRTVTWYIGDLPPNGSGCVELTVQVNSTAEPGGIITNCCEMTGDCMTIPVTACEDTPVCCWRKTAIYVDADANGSNNGTSWEDAYNYLQDALEAALTGGPCVDIWVAEGIYKPDQSSVEPNGTGERGATFELIDGVEIKGGYAGFGAENPDARDIKQYETILSGDIGAFGNSDRVVTASGTDETAVLDGFTITGGNGDSGCGMYNYNGSPTITNCTFSGNSATSDLGGGMYNEDGNPTIINCIFTGNLALGYEGSGGGMCIVSGNPTIINCIFTGNSALGAEGDGGGIYVGGLGNVTVTNCILWDNSPEQIYGSATVTYSDIQDGWEGDGSNIDEDPRLAADGYHLRCWCSPCIDAGTNTPPGGLPLEDIDGEERVIDGNCDGEATVDMGADEYYLANCNILACAHCPNPVCGATDVPVDTVLSWSPGKYAASHDVYLGNDFNDVNDANITNGPCGVLVSQNQEPNYYPAAGLLEFDTTYYWRIDEVNENASAPPGSPWKGEVWSFTTGNYLVVEDFESYANEAELEDVWGLTGSDIALDANIVHSGDHSMKYEYTNDTVPYYTEADANTTGPNSLPVITQDWTIADIKTLVLYFYGNGGNDAEQIYVALKDTDSNTAVVYYDGDPNDINEPEWHEWNIELSDFNNPNDVNLSSIDKVYIGFGNRESPAAGGSGTVYFDDIRLYIRRCVVAFGPDGDIDEDCDVDFVDFSIMASDWREKDSIRAGSDADVNGGTWVNDTTIPQYGGPRGRCIELDGINGWVDLDDSDFSNFRNKTIAFWVNVKEYPSVYRYLFYFSDEGDDPYRIYFMTKEQYYVRVRFLEDYTGDFGAGLDFWTHLAFVLEDTDEGCTGTFYADGGDGLTPGEPFDTMAGRPRHSGGASGVNLGSFKDGTGSFVNARFDDFRVYDYALSGSEIADLYDATKVQNPSGTAPDANMLVHYKFDETSGLIADNNSPYEFYHPLLSDAELYEGEAVGSREVNFRDLAILADNWLEENLWP